MPKAPLSAHALALPALTRRGFLIGSAAALATPQATATQADAELTALGRAFEQALAAYADAQRRFNDCEARYCELDPPCPVALTQQGPLGHRITRDWDWLSARDLRALLADPDEHADHAAARLILPVARAYAARERRLSRVVGLDAAEAAYWKAGDALDDVGVRIADAPAHSLDGLALKARVVKTHAAPEWWSECGTSERIAAQVLDAVIGMARPSP